MSSLRSTGRLREGLAALGLIYSPARVSDGTAEWISRRAPALTGAGCPVAVVIVGLVVRVLVVGVVGIVRVSVELGIRV